MGVEHIEVMVEEPSMEAALRLLLPKILRKKTFDIYNFQCKQQLLAVLPQRLRGYRRWLPTNWRIVVVVDCDDNDCRKLKSELEKTASDAGFSTRSHSYGTPWNVVNRIVIEELEAWYFGDWEAVKMAFPRVPSTIPLQAKYRDPDSIAGGTWEAFERILQRADYFKSGLRKIEAAKAIAGHMLPEQNRSHSFRIFLSTFKELESM